MDITPILLGMMVFAFTWIYFKRRTASKKGQPIPGAIGLPYLGSCFSVNLTKLHLTFYEWALSYGKIFQVTLFGQKLVVLNDADLIRKAYASDEYGDYFCDRPETFFGKYVVYDGNDIVFATDYDKKRVILRKMLSKCMRLYGDGHQRFESKVQDEIVRFLGTIRDSGGKDFEVKPVFKHSFGNLMSIWLSGKEARIDDSEILWGLNDSITFILETSMSLFLLSFPFVRHLPGKLGNFFRKTIESRDQLEKRYIYSRIQSGDNDDEEDSGLVDALIKYQQQENKKAGFEIITDINVKGIILDLIGAAMTTTTNALIACVLILLNNPQCIKPIQDEIDRVVGRDRLPKVSDKADMDYTRAAVLELLRYISHGSLGIPHKIKNDQEFEGYHFSKDAIIFTNIWFMNRDPAIWKDPWTFDPTRFLDDEGKLVPLSHKNRQTLLNFSAGRRGCPGGDLATSRIFLYLTGLLQNFDLLPPLDELLMRDDPKDFVPGMILEPKDFKCRVIPRE